MGLDKFNPTSLSSPKRVEPIKVKPKLTRNCIDNRRSLPNINWETTADSTNIHANEQMNPAKAELDRSQDATTGIGPDIDAATVVRADCVKIW